MLSFFFCSGLPIETSPMSITNVMLKRNQDQEEAGSNKP